MKLVPLTEDMLRTGSELPVALRDGSGRLLMARGGVIENDAALGRLMRLEPHVQEDEVLRLQRAWVQKLDRMIQDNENLGRIAALRRNSPEVWKSLAHQDTNPNSQADLQSRLWALQLHVGNTLKDPNAPDFLSRLEEDAEAVLELMRHHSDDVLLILISHATREYRDYAIHHCLLVGAVCAVVALQDAQRWTPDGCTLLVRAALTMNLSILSLQNQLASQSAPLSSQQQGLLHEHGRRSAQVLREAGVSDAQWLEAVATHHETQALAWEGDDAATAMARLIHKADVFCARLSPRKGRTGLDATSAARFAYLDESGMPDAVGARLIRALGVFPPGTMVRLANQETGVVRRRDDKPASPVVASLLGASGMPLAEPVLRHTSDPAFRVQQALGGDAVKLSLNLPLLLSCG